MSRPELTGHASIYYNAKEARKYDSSSRMIGVQREITERAIELLKLDEGKNQSSCSLILDIGCGSGLSGQVLEEYGHVWVGCDVSRDMLLVAKDRMEHQQRRHRRSLHSKTTTTTTTATATSMEEDDDEEEDDEEDDEDDGEDNDDEEEEDGQDNVQRQSSKKSRKLSSSSSGDLMHHDMGTGLPFRPATFDACISISALQWLCYSHSKAQIPQQRLARFFGSLYSVLKRTGRAVLQFYPETAEQAVLVSQIAAKVGFAGGIVVDYPNSTKAKKHYLVLTPNRANNNNNHKLPPALTSQDNIHNVPDGSLLAAAAVASGGVQVGASSSSSSFLAHGNKKKTNKNPMPPRKHKGAKTKEWILHKKESQRKKGKVVRPDSKYTARRRPHKF